MVHLCGEVVHRPLGHLLQDAAARGAHADAGVVERRLELGDTTYIVDAAFSQGNGQYNLVVMGGVDMQDLAVDGTSDIVELQVLGDWAYLRNRLSVTITAPGGSPKTRSGYTLTILRKERDGKWRLTRDANLLT